MENKKYNLLIYITIRLVSWLRRSSSGDASARNPLSPRCKPDRWTTTKHADLYSRMSGGNALHGTFGNSVPWLSGQPDPATDEHATVVHSTFPSGQH